MLLQSAQKDSRLRAAEAEQDMNPLTFIPIAIFVLYLLNSIKILPEYERGVIFRLGRLLPQPKGPGIFLVFAPLDQMVRISLRQEALEVPPQDIITRDNVTLKVNAVIFLRVVDPQQRGDRGDELPLPDLAVRADHAALGAGRSGTRRTALAIATSSTCASRPSSTSTPRPGA